MRSLIDLNEVDRRCGDGIINAATAEPQLPTLWHHSPTNLVARQRVWEPENQRARPTQDGKTAVAWDCRARLRLR